MCRIGYWNVEDIKLLKIKKIQINKENSDLELINHQEKPLYLRK